MLQVDYTTLKFITKELEAALSESRMSYVTRIMRNIK
jgi:hypothetical protein